MSCYTKKIEKLILDRIDLSGYDLPNKIQCAYKVFKGEKPGQNEFSEARDWFQGLCNAVSMPYTYHDIMKALNCSEKWAIESYWDSVAIVFLDMARKASTLETGILKNVEYHDTSKMGNNRYYCEIGNSPLLFGPVDSSLNITMRNNEGKHCAIEWKWLRNKRTIVSIDKL